MSIQPEGSVAVTGAEDNGFAAIQLDVLDAMSSVQLDALPYGVVVLAIDGTTQRYNATEAKLAGIKSSTVIGCHYFNEIAQCMNNFMVAQRFEDEPEIDDIIDYTLTLRMRPTPVRLRLLKSSLVSRRYLLIER